MPELCFQMQISPKLREKLSGGWDIYCIEERGIGSGVNFWTGENGGGERAKWAGGEVANMNKLMANWRANKIKNSVIIIPG